MVVMTEYSKGVFSDPKLLREKLMLFLGTPEKVEIYAQSCEKFFIAGAKQGLKFSATWSWWAFLAGFWFFLYRKDYLVALCAFIFFFPFTILLGIFGKYSIMKRFVTYLNSENDAILIANGGKNSWVIPIIIILCLLSLLLFAI